MCKKQRISILILLPIYHNNHLFFLLCKLVYIFIHMKQWCNKKESKGTKITVFSSDMQKPDSSWTKLPKFEICMNALQSNNNIVECVPQHCCSIITVSSDFTYLTPLWHDSCYAGVVQSKNVTESTGNKNWSSSSFVLLILTFLSMKPGPV